MADSGRIAFSVGVELSYLNEEQQTDLASDAELLDKTPSYSQAVRMHREHLLGELTFDRIREIMDEDKPNQKEHLSLPMDRISKYIPKGYTDDRSTLNAECVCAAVGKEAYAAEKEKG